MDLIVEPGHLNLCAVYAALFNRRLHLTKRIKPVASVVAEQTL